MSKKMYVMISSRLSRTLWKKLFFMMSWVKEHEDDQKRTAGWSLDEGGHADERLCCTFLLLRQLLYRIQVKSKDRLLYMYRRWGQRTREGREQGKRGVKGAVGHRWRNSVLEQQYIFTTRSHALDKQLHFHQGLQHTSAHCARVWSANTELHCTS